MLVRQACGRDVTNGSMELVAWYLCGLGHRDLSIPERGLDGVWFMELNAPPEVERPIGI